MKELSSLQEHIEHIKAIVTMQQRYATATAVKETVNAVDLVEDSLRLNAGALDRHQIELVRDYQARPTLTVDKHEVVQILVNLVRNAKHACSESRSPPPTRDATRHWRRRDGQIFGHRQRRRDSGRAPGEPVPSRLHDAQGWARIRAPQRGAGG